MSIMSLSQRSLTRVSAIPEFRAALGSTSVLLLTSVHHAYGAVVYNTPWRMHVVYLAIPAAVLISGLFYLAWMRRHHWTGRAAKWAAAVIAAAFPIGMIGMFEGGYNHVLKNILYFSGVTGALFQELFPTPAYEVPSDLFFEDTGIAQFFVALMAAVAVARVIRRRFQ